MIRGDPDRWVEDLGKLLPKTNECPPKILTKI